MSSYGFQLDLKQGLLKVDSEQLILNYREDISVRAILAEDTEIDGRREAFVISREELVAKLLSIAHERIPVRVIHFNHYPVTLKGVPPWEITSAYPLSNTWFRQHYRSL